MRAVVLALACFVTYSPPTGLSAQRAQGQATDRFAGAWGLVGQPAGALGYLVYDPAGYMTLAIQGAGRPDLGDTAPTPPQARAALDSYTAYWGPFVADPARGILTHQTFGALDPAVSGRDVTSRFTMSGNRLTLQPAAVTGAAVTTPSGLTWERLPDLPSLTPTHRRLIGFWRLVSWESRRVSDGAVTSSSPGMTGFIVYTASGHVIVHMMYPYRRRYVGLEPTADETMATYRGYTGYLGHYTVNEAEHYVVHHIDATLNSGPIGTDYLRYLEFSGRKLTLKPPVTKTAAGDVQTRLTWERISD